MTEVIEQIKVKEIKQGKEKRNVPRLRFRGFEDEWIEKRISDFLDFYTTNSLSRENLTYEKGEIKNIHYGDIHMKFPVMLDVEKNSIPFINDLVDASKFKCESFCRKGDIIIADASENYEDIGKVVEIVNMGNSKVVAGLHTILGRDNTGTTSVGFKGYMFQSNNVRKQIKVLAAGAKVLGISKSNLSSIRVNIPILQEQKKIADFFSLVDKKIEKQSEKVEALKTYQKGIMQKIFKQEIRFEDENGREYPEWEEKRLGEFLIPRVEKQIPTNEAPLMAFTSTGGIESKGERYDRSFLVKNHKKLYKRTELNDFIYSSNNLDVGSIGLNKYGTAVISDVYEIFIINNQASLVFISTMIKMPKMLYKIIQYRQGVMYGQYRIHTDNFLKVKDFMPCLEEQIKIANLFNAIDKKIEKEEEKLEDLKVWKKGLLQKMFI